MDCGWMNAHQGVQGINNYHEDFNFKSNASMSVGGNPKKKEI